MTLARSSRPVSGFTLIELVVVMFIIGLGLFALLPKLDFTSSENLGDAGRLSALVSEAMTAAAESGATQSLIFDLSSALVKWTDREVTLSNPVGRILVNGKQMPGIRHSLRVFSDGHMDWIMIYLSTGEKLTGDPLSGSFSYEAESAL